MPNPEPGYTVRGRKCTAPPKPKTSHSMRGVETDPVGGPELFFEQVCEAFDLAIAAVGDPVDRFFHIGGRIVRLRFAGSALIPMITPALEHLTVSPHPHPDLTVCLWDSDSTGIVAPAIPIQHAPPTHDEETRYLVGKRIKIAFSPGVGTLHMFDSDAQVGVFHTGKADRIPPWEIASPLRPTLGWWASHTGGQLAHAAAVGTSDGGLLLAARGGSGKSTVAMACLEAGLLYAGDDYVMLRDPDQPIVHSLYNSAKLDPVHMQRKLPALAKYTIDHPYGHDKSVLILKDSHRSQLIDRMKLRAILVPSISDTARTVLQPTSAISVLKALAPTTVFQLPGVGADTFRTLGQIVQRVPGYALHIGTNLDEVVAAIRHLLAQERTPDTTTPTERL